MASQSQRNKTQQGFRIRQRGQRLHAENSGNFPRRLRDVHLRGVQRRRRSVQQLFNIRSRRVQN